MSDTTLTRDPFARTELVRSTMAQRDRVAPCNECGTQHARFQYAVVSDDAPHRARWSRPFCSVTCYRAYS